MTLEKCKSCKNHALYREGYVLCDYWKKIDQRIITEREENLYIVYCPKEESSIDYKKLFTPRGSQM